MGSPRLEHHRIPTGCSEPVSALRLSAAQLRGPLEETAIDLGAPGRDPNFGAGRIDAFAAHTAARALAKLEGG